MNERQVTRYKKRNSQINNAIFTLSEGNELSFGKLFCFYRTAEAVGIRILTEDPVLWHNTSQLEVNWDDPLLFSVEATWVGYPLYTFSINHQVVAVASMHHSATRATAKREYVLGEAVVTNTSES